MMRCVFLFALALPMLHGCARPVGSNEPTVRTIDAADPVAMERAWEAAREVLRRQRFEIDRLDRREGVGVMTSRPLASQSAFEFWRHDVDTRYDLLESTLNPIRRRVRVRVSPVDGTPQATVDVRVTKERLARPERQFSSSLQVLHFFGERLPGTAGQLRIGSESEYWMDLGRDPAMERYLADRIVDRCRPAPGEAD